MKYTKKLYYGNFTPARLIRPKNRSLRLFTDTLLCPWYVLLFAGICSFYPTALCADTFRFLKFQYIKLNHVTPKYKIDNTLQHRATIIFSINRSSLTVQHFVSSVFKVLPLAVKPFKLS